MAGVVFLLGGVVGVPTEVWWALHGAPLAWLAAAVMVPIGVTGALLLRAAIRGRVRRRNFSIGRRPS